MANGRTSRTTGSANFDKVKSSTLSRRLKNDFVNHYKSFLSNVKGAAEEARRVLEDIVEQGDIDSLEKIFEYLDKKGETIDKIYTGKVNLLHIATSFGYDNRGKDILRLISGKCPELLKVRLGKKQTCLHIAVSQQNVQAASIVLQELDRHPGMSPSDIINDCLAMPEDNKVYDAESRDYKDAEVGFPLAIAAWNTNTAMIDVLVKYGAKLDQQTLYSQNTVFHILIQAASHPSAREDKGRVTAIKQTFSYLLKQAEEESRRSVFRNRMADVFRTLNISNAVGDIPLIMAARLANHQMFEHIHNIFFCYRHLHSTDGTSDTFTYDITEVDGAISGNKNLSALEAFTNSPYVWKTEDVFLFVNSNPAKQMISEKWKAYRGIFWSWAVCHITVMVLLTASAVLRPVSTLALQNGTLITHFSGAYYNWYEAWPPLQTATDALSMSYLVLFFTFEVFSTVKLSERKLGKKASKSAKLLKCATCPFGIYTIRGLVLDRSVLWGFLITLSGGFVCRFVDYLSEEIFIVLYLLLGWIFVLFFFKAVRLLSYFIKVIRTAILGDFLKVLSVYIIFVFACTSAMSVAFKSSSDAPQDYTEFVQNLQFLFLLSIGLGEADSLGKTRAPFLGILVFIIFIITSYIVFMNVLIALLSDTTTRLSKYKKEEWELSRLQIILYIESLMFSRLGSFKVICGESDIGRKGYSRWNSDTDDDMQTPRMFFQVKSVVPSKTLPSENTPPASDNNPDSQTPPSLDSVDGRKRPGRRTQVIGMNGRDRCYFRSKRGRVKKSSNIAGHNQNSVPDNEPIGHPDIAHPDPLSPIREGHGKSHPVGNNQVSPRCQYPPLKKDDFYMETNEVLGSSNVT